MMAISRRSRVSVLVLVSAALVAAVPAWAQSHYAGAIGPGSFYEIDVPPIWNGDLVLYAHGIVQADEPVALPTTQDGYNELRTWLLAGGYAVAASSYSTNGWSLADAVRRTHQLSAIFTSKVGLPGRRLLVGYSMGALAIIKLAEQHPGQYDGALTMCGPLGGALRELNYAGDLRVTFDYYFPGLLPGTTFQVPEGTDYRPPSADDPDGSELFQQVYHALTTNPGVTLQWAAAAGLPFQDTTELFGSALYAVGFVLRYTNDFIDRVNGKIPFDNSDRIYQVNVSPDAATNAYLSGLLNAGVQRFVADRAAVNYYEHNYMPSGQIGIPVIALHTARDPGIPYWHEERFAEAVSEAGREELLDQRRIDGWGHCAIPPDDVAAAFTDLAQWVETGTRP